MLYCQSNASFVHPWVDNGFTPCFIETISSVVLLVYITFVGGLQCRIYHKYSTDLDCRLLPKRRLFHFQVFLHVFIPCLAFLRLILQAEVLDSKTLYGYMVFSACSSFVIWPVAIHVLLLERQRLLPSVPSRGHGLILLVFWALVFINENLTFVNLWSPKWWFRVDSLSSKIELTLFIFKYLSALSLFVIGLKAPGIPTAQDYFVYHQITTPVANIAPTGNTNQRETSTFFNIWKMRKLLAPFIWPKKNYLLQMRVIVCFVILILGRVVNIFVPIYNKNIVNSLTSENLTFRWDYILIFVGLWFLQGQGNNSFLNNLRSFLWIRIQQYTVKEVQLELYQHLHGLSLRWHISRKFGEVLRVMDRGTTSATSLLSYIIFNILPTFADIFIAVVYFALAFNIWFGLIVLVTMVLYLAFTITLTEWRTKFRREMNKLDNAVEAKCVDSFLNFETVKYYSAERYELENYEKCIDKYQVAEWVSTASLNLLNVVQNSLITLGVMAGALLCAHLIVDGNQLTAGDYVLFSTYILQLYTPLNYFGTYYRMIQTAFIDMENMFDLFNETPEITDAPNAEPLKIKEGQIEFRDVSFSYIPERPILKNISFVVPPAHTVALVGPTGSGKSTIVRLLFRFYDIQSGDILIDDQNVSMITQKSLRSCIGVVPQDTVLFNSDIRYNIRYGKVTATDEEVEEAAKAADIHSQILNFPEGYDTIVGERGLKLSGGEKQRVAIARTILKAPHIVLLDEATSSLDTQTERNIQNSLATVCANRTTLIVAHRLSTIIHADQILVIQDGEIVERGRHEDLLQQQNIYAAMWQQQLENSKESDKVEADVEE